MMPRLRGVVCTDAASCWKEAGFTISKHGGKDVCLVPPLAIYFEDSAPAQAKTKGFVSWIWSGISNSVSQVDGVSATVLDDSKLPDMSKPVHHKNGVTSVDHIVLRSADLAKTKKAFEDIGVSLRRERSDVYPGVTQLFYRPAGELIIEVAAPSEGSSGDNPLAAKTDKSFLWGATLNVNDDLNTAKGLLKDSLSDIRKAKQAGRKIATLRHKNFGISVAIALMTPHVKQPSNL